MRHAPPVSVRCHGGWPWRVLRAGLPALAVGVLVLWLAQHLQHSNAALLKLPLRWHSIADPAAGLGGLVFWDPPVSPDGVGTALALVLALLAALAVAAMAWQRTRPNACDLTWDGQRWSADGATGRVAVMMDLGPWLLLRWWPDSGVNKSARWLAVSGREAGASWHALRAALYSRAPPAAPPIHPHSNASRSAGGPP